jgi:hypothetical protein
VLLLGVFFLPSSLLLSLCTPATLSHPIGYDYPSGSGLQDENRATNAAVAIGKPIPKKKPFVPRATSSDEEEGDDGDMGPAAAATAAPRDQMDGRAMKSAMVQAPATEQNVHDESSPASAAAEHRAGKKQLRIQEPPTAMLQSTQRPSPRAIPRAGTVRTVPGLLVATSLGITSFNVYCRTLSKGKFTSTVKDNNVVVRMRPETFPNPEGVEMVGTNELNQPLVRVIPFPVMVDPESKKATYDAKFGLIKISFRRL